MLEIEGLTTRYGAIAALRDATLSVGANEIVGLLGARDFRCRVVPSVR